MFNEITGFFRFNEITGFFTRDSIDNHKWLITDSAHVSLFCGDDSNVYQFRYNVQDDAYVTELIESTLDQIVLDFDGFVWLAPRYRSSL